MKQSEVAISKDFCVIHRAAAGLVPTCHAVVARADPSQAVRERNTSVDAGGEVARAGDIRLQVLGFARK